MLELKIKDKEYKIQFGYNQFIDTDLMDRVKGIMKIMISADGKAESNKDITVDDVSMLKEEQIDEAMKNFDLLKEVFSTTRELLFVGCQKHNALLNVLEAGDLMDDYEGSVQDLFMQFVNELFAGGFMGDLMKAGQKPRGRKKAS